ncbi:GAF domain-containing sensor histidine kinase [Methylobacterium sp. NMS12]|uniref:GAF domain-containing sensor histidine kinase n=1 Tax=Methylobacterium sp. NMS12 TaxID=3079766 RepID=UPI003F883121
MENTLYAEVETVRQIPAVPSILEVISRTTGMGFVAVARVTRDRWIACEVLDNIDFGLKPHGELKTETTICNEVELDRELVVIDDCSEDSFYKDHRSPALYGYRSYISTPIILADHTFFGTLCAIDPRPMRLNVPEVIGMFKLFAELIAVHIDARRTLITAQDDLKTSQVDLAASNLKLTASEKSFASSQSDLAASALKLSVSETDLASSRSELIDAREASELREQFIAVLGHDLRNPLAAISGGTTLLLKRPPEEKQKTILLMMTASVQRMNGLIGNLMDFARGRLGGGLTLKTETKLLTPTLMHVVDEIRTAWPDRVIETDFELEEPVTADHSRISQLFSNLLGNAITHGSPDKPITVRATNNDEGLRLAVCNSGKAIPDDLRASLFKPFYRGNGGSLQGLGLGLFIVSEIARAHGGNMAVTSDDVQTCFTLSIPLAAP